MKRVILSIFGIISSSSFVFMLATHKPTYYENMFAIPSEPVLIEVETTKSSLNNNNHKEKLWDQEIISATTFFSKNNLLTKDEFKKDGIMFFVGDYFTYFTDTIKKIEKKTEAANLNNNNIIKYYWNPSGNHKYLNFWHTMVKEVSYCTLNLVKECPYVTKNVVDKYYNSLDYEKNSVALLISEAVQKVNGKFKKLVDDFDYLLEINNISI